MAELQMKLKRQALGSDDSVAASAPSAPLGSSIPPPVPSASPPAPPVPPSIPPQPLSPVTATPPPPPNASLPLDFGVGDEVCWKGADDDLPEGTPGRVVKVHPQDHDAECVFQTTDGPRTFTFALDRLTLIARAPASAAPAAAPRAFAPPPPPAPVDSAQIRLSEAPALFMPPPPDSAPIRLSEAPSLFMPPPPDSDPIRMSEAPSLFMPPPPPVAALKADAPKVFMPPPPPGAAAPASSDNGNTDL